MIHLLTLENLKNTLRSFRKYHRVIGLALSFFVIISCITGVLLSWKKQSDWMQPSTLSGAMDIENKWVSIPKMEELAIAALDSINPGHANPIDRMDVRPSKRVAKVLFEQGYWEVQLDGVTGEVLSVRRRYSDLIEQIHDGSILGETTKIFSMNILGNGLLFLTISGLVLWLFPKTIRKRKMKNSN